MQQVDALGVPVPYRIQRHASYGTACGWAPHDDIYANKNIPKGTVGLCVAIGSAGAVYNIGYTMRATVAH